LQLATCGRKRKTCGDSQYPVRSKPFFVTFGNGDKILARSRFGGASPKPEGALFVRPFVVSFSH
jgi:hypothetical protein